MVSLGLIRGGFKITSEGKLWISDLFGDASYEGIFDITRNSKGMKEFLKNHLDDYIRVYSFADAIKQDIGINILGLSYEQVYGTDEQKNSLTHLMWEDMPGIIDPNSELWKRELHDSYFNLILHEPGPMTGREVLQYIGTEFFRRIYPNVWVDTLIRRINEHSPALALIADLRFPNELEGVQNTGGKVVRLDRVIFPDDTHASETSLDRDKFDWDRFDVIIENQNMSIKENCDSVYGVFTELGLITE